MSGDTLVQEAVVSRQELDQTPIVPAKTIDEQLRFAAEISLETFVKVRKHLGVGRRHVDLAKLQPLTGEILDHLLRPVILQQAHHLAREHGGGRSVVRGLPIPEARRQASFSRGRTTGETPALDR